MFTIGRERTPAPLPRGDLKMDKLLKIAIMIIFTIGLLFTASFAYDIDPHYKFSGVKSPDSPLKNTWGAFQTDLFSGSFSYEYKIDVPPGTNGLAPKMSIGYNSHSAKGKAGWVGAGWDIPLGYIQRNIQYTRKEISDDTFELYLDGAKHDLIFVGTPPADLSATPYVGLYKTKNETYLRIEFKSGGQNEKGGYWIVTAKDGTEYRLGYNLDSENMINSSDSSFTKYVWRWSLDQIKDSNLNYIFFTYLENPYPENGNGDKGAVYLRKIEYNNEKKRAIEFIPEGTDKPDMYLTIEQGSEVQESRRLSEIQIKVTDEDGLPVLARKYKLNYVMNEIGNRSLLSSITQYGDDGVSTLPPVTFDYLRPDNGFGDFVPWTPYRTDIRKFDKTLNDTIGDTFDVNGDGLPDIVRYDVDAKDHWDVWLNRGDSFPSGAGDNVDYQIPSGWAIRNNDVPTDSTSPNNTKTAPMDINGDGYVDFLRAEGKGQLQFRLNNGSDFSNTTTSWPLPPGAEGAYLRDVQDPPDAPVVQQSFLDINGDSRPDIVKREKSGDLWYWHIWRNTGSGFADYGLWRVHQNVGLIEDFTQGDTVNTEVSHYDVNGDGLVDIVIAYDYIWRIWLNTGSDFIDGGSWDTHDTSHNHINDTNDDGRVKRDFIDINGDGLPDIVDPVACSQQPCNWQVWYNTGKGFTAMQYWTVPTDVPPNGFISMFDADGNCSRDVFDLDGDGAVDLVRVDGGIWKVYSNKAGQADLLSKVTDTFGGTVLVGYRASPKYLNRLPQNFWVVTSSATDNGITGPHALSSTTNYSYAQGLYDFPTREFRGFGQVTETRADGSKVIHYYYQKEEGKKGKEYRTEINSSSDAPFAKTENAWSGAYCETPLNGVYACNPSKTDEYTFDGVATNPKLKSMEYQNYDSFGNVGLLIDYGDWNLGGDEVYTYNEYWPSCSSTYIVDKLKHKYIKPSPAGSNLREGFYWYDNSTSCVSKGNLTKEEKWLNTGGNPITLYEYDSYGNRNKTTDPEGRVTRFEFDSTYHTFPVNTYNAKNQLTTRSFNLVNGQVIQETDPNGFTTTYVYDTFQRKIREVKPYDTDSSPTVTIQYVMDGIPPESVIVYKKDGTPTFDTVQFVDGFGNLIQTKAEYESNMNKTVVDVFYDEMGRVKKQSNPYLTDSTLAYSSPDVTAPGTGYTS
jgi:YD repeat-containing protein